MPHLPGDQARVEVALAHVSNASLFDLVSITRQGVFVFNGTIRENDTMFSERTDEEVEMAARMSGLSRLVAERRWDYLCGENCSGLSGGERQRVSIARALLRRTPMMLVDEATAALDAETTSVVFDASRTEATRATPSCRA
jgi:ABC-type multidrug transport system fused ATPase/permease subunit